MLGDILLTFLLYRVATYVLVGLPVALSIGFLVYVLLKKPMMYIVASAGAFVLLTTAALLPFDSALQEGADQFVSSAVIASVAIALLWWMTTKKKAGIAHCVVLVGFVALYTLVAFTQ